MAYLNVDCAVQGSGFFAGATPQLDGLLVDALKLVLIICIVKFSWFRYRKMS